MSIYFLQLEIDTSISQNAWSLKHSTKNSTSKNMVKTIHHRIQVYKCFAVIDIGSKHENRDCKKINLNNENNARFMQMCYTYCQNAYE